VGADVHARATDGARFNDGDRGAELGAFDGGGERGRAAADGHKVKRFHCSHVQQLACLGGHFTGLYEQKTQQSPGLGLRTAWHPLHS
jgi:hypothetical protein